MKQKQNQNYILTWLTWIFILVIWLILSHVGEINITKLPTPENVLKQAASLCFNGYNNIPLWHHIGISLLRLSVAISAALITAIPLGLLCGYFSKLQAVIGSVVDFIKPLPPLAYYTLLIIWLGIDEESKVALLFIAAFAPIFVSAASSVSRVNLTYVLSARSFGASTLQIFFKVILPATLPEIFVGIRTAVAVAYTTLVSAEMIAATAGIGWMVLDAYKYLKTDVVFVGIFIMGLTGMILDIGLRKIESRFIFWGGK
ncbi:MAG: ABC transporter permease [Ruminococcaceae bacterium]|nr:ABC transporter permease [Oscillospiraceae bacterium]